MKERVGGYTCRPTLTAHDVVNIYIFFGASHVRLFNVSLLLTWHNDFGWRGRGSMTTLSCSLLYLIKRRN